MANVARYSRDKKRVWQIIIMSIEYSVFYDIIFIILGV